MFTIQDELNQSKKFQASNTVSFFNRESLQILTGTIIHLKDIVIISKQTYEETYPGYFDQNELEALFGEKTILDQLNDGCHYFFIARYGGRYIGYAKIFIENTGATLDKLYFLKQFQGKGYGGQLLNKCLTYTCNLGFNCMKLYVHDQNTQAINFYMKNGFVLHEQKIHYFRPDGSGTTDYNFFMECPDIKAHLSAEMDTKLAVK